MNTIKEIMDELDATYSDFLDSHMRTMKLLLDTIKNKYYDSMAYFGYSVSMIKTFGVDGEVTIPKEVMNASNTGELYRLDQIINEDGSMTIKAIKMEQDENSDNNSVSE